MEDDEIEETLSHHRIHFGSIENIDISSENIIPIFMRNRFSHLKSTMKVNQSFTYSCA